MECVEGHNPVFLDLVKSEVDHLPDAGSHADLDQAGLLLQVLFCHELHLVLELLFFFLRLLVRLLASLVFGTRCGRFLRRSSCCSLGWCGVRVLVTFGLPDGSFWGFILVGGHDLNEIEVSFKD